MDDCEFKIRGGYCKPELWVVITIYNLDKYESSSGNNTCGNNTNCVNNPGNYSCPCNVGLTPVSNLPEKHMHR